jgi:hypothetical protein
MQALILAIGRSVMCAWGRDAAAPENETVSPFEATRGVRISAEGSADRPESRWRGLGLAARDFGGPTLQLGINSSFQCAHPTDISIAIFISISLAIANRDN